MANRNRANLKRMVYSIHHSIESQQEKPRSGRGPAGQDEKPACDALARCAPVYPSIRLLVYLSTFLLVSGDGGRLQASSQGA